VIGLISFFIVPSTPDDLHFFTDDEKRYEKTAFFSAACPFTPDAVSFVIVSSRIAHHLAQVNDFHGAMCDYLSYRLMSQ